MRSDINCGVELVKQGDGGGGSRSPRGGCEGHRRVLSCAGPPGADGEMLPLMLGEQSECRSCRRCVAADGFSSSRNGCCLQEAAAALLGKEARPHTSGDGQGRVMHSCC